MDDIQDQWRKGYLKGWEEQGVFSTSAPTIPPRPSTPADVTDAGTWAYNEGKSRGMIDRLKSQAGLP